MKKNAAEKKPRRGGWLRWVLFALGLFLGLWFLAPILGGIVTAIGLAGAAACLVLVLGCLFWPRLRALLQRLWKKKGLRLPLGLLAGMLAAGVVLLGTLTGVVVAHMHTTAQDCDVLVVLGCQVRGEQPSLLLGYRIDAAADFLKEHPDTVCIVSGGQGSGENITEAECMYRSLVRRGIDPERIYLEDRSTSTAENLRFSKELMDREGLTGSLALVSNNFHLYRAGLIARSQGLEAKTVCARSNWYSLLTFTVREAVGVVYFWLFQR